MDIFWTLKAQKEGQMGTFRAISELEEVERVRNLYPQTAEPPLDLLFFTCPQMRGSRRRNRIRVNDLGTGLVATYEKISRDSLFRVDRAKTFAETLSNLGVRVGSLTNIFGAADALILFNPPIDPPEVPQIQGIRTIGNHEIVKRHLTLWSEFHREQPWLSCPSWARKMEEERLRNLLPSTVPENLAADFVRRVFAGFALDGLLIRKGEFGTTNPVILGVESPGVAVLQNAALDKRDWLPVIQLKV